MSFIIKKLNYIKNNYFIEAIILTIIGMVLLNTLFIHPIIGKCDNGDFGRFYFYGGLKDLASDYNNMYDYTVHINYIVSNLGCVLPFGPNWVSGTLLLKIAEVISLLSVGVNNGLFDIRYLTFVYCIIFLISVFLIINNKFFSRTLKITAGIYIILFFTDVCYIAYFNSFFGEAGTVVFFFLTIGIFLHLINREKPKVKHFVLFFIASGGFLTSKSQELPLLLFMLIIYGGLYFYYKEKKLRKSIIIGALTVIVLCAGTYFSLSQFTNYNNVYQSVFFGVLHGSKTPEKDLEELGVNKKFLAFKGVSFYNQKGKNNPMGEEMLKEFYPKVNTGKMLVFYLKHPMRLWSKTVDSAEHAYRFNKIGEGNFVKGQYNKTKIYNGFRQNLINLFPILHHNIYIFITFSIGFLTVLVFYFLKYKDKNIRLLMVMLLFILAAGASQLVLPVIGSGECDFEKHLFLISLAYDTMFGIAVLWLIYIIQKVYNWIFARKGMSK